MYIKMDGYTIPDNKIKKEGYSVKLENTYSQAKRTNTLLMVKILIGKVYTLNVTLINITSDEIRQIQRKALNPNIQVEFFDDQYVGDYVTQDMYCTTVDATASTQRKDGKIIYDEITLEFIANQKV